MAALAASGEGWLCRHDSFDCSLFLNTEASLSHLALSCATESYLLTSWSYMRTLTAAGRGVKAGQSNLEQSPTREPVASFFSLVASTRPSIYNLPSCLQKPTPSKTRKSKLRKHAKSSMSSMKYPLYWYVSLSSRIQTSLWPTDSDCRTRISTGRRCQFAYH